jgi:succinoglycan biosynthesis transport protein ExoP
VNRRLLIFLLVFLVVCATGLAYTWSLTPTYLATARLQVEPGSDPDKAPSDATFVANQAQALTSNEMFERLSSATSRRPELWKFTTIPRLRQSLSAVVSPGTNVIELQARGADRELLPEVLRLWAAAYLESRGDRRTVDRELTIADARKAVVALEQRVAQRRGAIDEFRRRNNIVSPEREENEVASEMKSLTSALNDARTKAIEAESRLSSIKTGIAEGKTVYRPQDKLALTQLEQRLLDLRQKLKDQEVNFTPQYLALEPSVRAAQANIQQLEKQIEEHRRSSQQASLAEASQDLLTAKKNVARLEAQVGQRRSDALKFTSRFSENKAQTAELVQLEAQLTRARQRLATLENSERAREPHYELLGRPVVPESPVHPNYMLYTAGSVGGALIAGLFSVLLVEFLNPRPRPEPPSTQPIIQIAYPALPGGYAPALTGPVTALPLSPQALPPPSAHVRELAVEEVRAMWDAATSDGRLAIAALFSGLTLEELAHLNWDAVDLDSHKVAIATPRYRLQPITTPFVDELTRRSASALAGAPVAASSTGARYSFEDLAGLVAAAAYDARLEGADTVDAEAARHTYISFLVRQGVRLSDLELLVGPVPPSSFLHYRTVSARRGSTVLTALDRVFPAFA